MRRLAPRKSQEPKAPALPHLNPATARKMKAVGNALSMSQTISEVADMMVDSLSKFVRGAFFVGSITAACCTAKQTEAAYPIYLSCRAVDGEVFRLKIDKTSFSRWLITDDGGAGWSNHVLWNCAAAKMLCKTSITDERYSLVIDGEMDLTDAHISGEFNISRSTGDFFLSYEGHSNKNGTSYVERQKSGICMKSVDPATEKHDPVL